MANNNNQNQKQEVQEQTQQQATTQEAPQQATVQQVVVVEKQGFGGWLKKHWKGVTAAITGLGITAGTAVVAYKKGKNAQAAQQYTATDDYSLNPNE